MISKKAGAFASLAMLGALVACSGTGGFSPSAGVSPQSGGASGAHASAAIHVNPHALTFKAVGAAHSQRFAVSETGYHKAFHLKDDCAKAVTFTAIKADGPIAIFKATPHMDRTCKATITDLKKHSATLGVTVAVVSATPSPSPTPSPTASPTPTATPTATASPTATPTSPSATPTPVISNGNFANGLTGWTPCSYARTGFSAPTNASPAPEATPTQNPESFSALGSSTLSALAVATSPPADLNPNESGSAPSVLGSDVALVGDPESETTGTAGICQTFTVDSTFKYLSFWVWEGGSEYSFKYGDQEADILDSTGTTLEQTLFSELNCFWDPGVVGDTGYTDSGCIPSADGSTSSYTDWQGGYWVERGPYDFSSYVGQTVTLFLGVWDLSTHAGPTTYGNEMYVGNVQFSSTDSFPSSFPYAHRIAHPLRAGHRPPNRVIP